MTVKRLSRHAGAEQIAEVLIQDGAVIIPAFVTAATCDAMAAELEPFLAEVEEVPEAGQESLNDAGVELAGNTKRLGALVARSETFRDVFSDPVITGVCDVALQKDEYHYHSGAALVIGPGASMQKLHRDADPYRLQLFPGQNLAEQPDVMLNAMIAVTDFTEANGATRFVPGSHRWPADRKAEPAEVNIAEMKKGSLLIWLGGTLHGAGANRTDEERFGLVMGYSLGCLRQEENQYIAVPIELARTLPEKVRRLVGYRTFRGYLGVADDLGEPTSTCASTLPQAGTRLANPPA